MELCSDADRVSCARRWLTPTEPETVIRANACGLGQFRLHSLPNQPIIPNPALQDHGRGSFARAIDVHEPAIDGVEGPRYGMGSRQTSAGHSVIDKSDEAQQCNCYYDDLYDDEHTMLHLQTHLRGSLLVRHEQETHCSKSTLETGNGLDVFQSLSSKNWKKFCLSPVFDPASRPCSCFSCRSSRRQCR